MPFCIHCGSQNPDAAKFCSNCGMAITTIAVKEPQPQQVQPPAQPTQVLTKIDPEPVQVQAATPIANQAQQTVNPLPLKQESSKNEIFRRPATWGVFLVIIGFFLPWETGYYSLSGFAIANELDSFFSNGNNNEELVKTIIRVLIYSIPISAFLFLIIMLSNSKISGLAKVLRLIPLICLVIYILLGVIGGAKVSIATMGIGLIISLIGGLCMIYLKKEF